MNISEFLIQQQRRERARRNAADVASKPQIFTGQVKIEGLGDCSVHVPFPFRFSEKPLLYTGFEVEGGDDIPQGKYPTADIKLLRFEIEEKEPIHRYFVGATLGVTTFGYITGQVFYVNYMFVGVALVNPSDGAIGS